MIDNHLQGRLVTVLQKAPIVQNRTGLVGLIATFPNYASICPDSGNLSADLISLVNHLIFYRSLQGEWFLLVFIDKVISILHGTELANELTEIRSQLEALLPPKVQAVHNAIEPYTFDLGPRIK